MGLNPGTIYWMEFTFFTLICCKNSIDVCLKRPKINEKEAGFGPNFFKKRPPWLALGWPATRRRRKKPPNGCGSRSRWRRKRSFAYVVHLPHGENWILFLSLATELTNWDFNELKSMELFSRRRWRLVCTQHGKLLCLRIYKIIETVYEANNKILLTSPRTKYGANRVHYSQHRH